MKNTTNYGLKKPETTDLYDIEDFNDNADVVDAKLKELEDNKAENEHSHDVSDINNFPSSMPPSSHTQAASTITAGTLGGAVVANASAVAALETSQIRNISVGTTELVAGTSTLACGDFYAMLEV